VHASYPEEDTFFPEIDWTQWEETSRSEMMTEEESQTPFEFVNYRRIQ
jgi:dihydrofolate reductase